MTGFTLDPDDQHAIDPDGNLMAVAGDWTVDVDGRQIRIVALYRTEPTS